MCGIIDDGKKGDFLCCMEYVWKTEMGGVHYLIDHDKYIVQFSFKKRHDFNSVWCSSLYLMLLAELYVCVCEGGGGGGYLIHDIPQCL